MKVISATLIGFLSGFMIYMLVGVAFLDTKSPEAFRYSFYNSLFWFLGGWIVTSYGVLRGASSTSKVWARGALIGASEWMLVGFVAVVYSGKVLVETTEGAKSSAGVAGASLGAGLFSMMGLGVAVFMAVACLIIYFIANRTPVEFQKEVVRIPCPQCAESIAVGAQKCRFCGAVIHAKA